MALSAHANATSAQSASQIKWVGWREFLWARLIQVINSYWLSSSAYGLMFPRCIISLGFSLMFLFSGPRLLAGAEIRVHRLGYNKLRVARVRHGRCIIRGRPVGVATYLWAVICYTWAFFWPDSSVRLTSCLTLPTWARNFIR